MATEVRRDATDRDECERRKWNKREDEREDERPKASTDWVRLVDSDRDLFACCCSTLMKSSFETFSGSRARVNAFHSWLTKSALLPANRCRSNSRISNTVRCRSVNSMYPSWIEQHFSKARSKGSVRPQVKDHAMKASRANSSDGSAFSDSNDCCIGSVSGWTSSRVLPSSSITTTIEFSSITLLNCSRVADSVLLFWQNIRNMADISLRCQDNVSSG